MRILKTFVSVVQCLISFVGLFIVWLYLELMHHICKYIARHMCMVVHKKRALAVCIQIQYRNYNIIS